MMEYVSRADESTVRALEENPELFDRLVSSLTFCRRNEADSFFGKPQPETWQIVIRPEFSQIQNSRRSEGKISGSLLKKSQLLRIEPAVRLKRTCVLMNTSMIDEPWCRPVFSKLIDSTDEVCVLAFSFFDDTKNLDDWNRQYARGQGIWYRSNTDVFFRYGLREDQVHWINYFTDSVQTIRETIAKSSILLLTGGAPDLMMKRIREKKLLSSLRHFQGLVIGYSAGAMIQLDDYHITPDEDYASYSMQKGLGYLKGFDIEVHYRASRIQKEYMHKTIQDRQLPVYALYEDGGMIVHPDGEMEFFGRTECHEA